MSQLADILSSKVRAEVFRLLFGADEEVHLRELARRSGYSLAAVRQELTRLGEMELVTPRRSGNRLYYRANRSHPLFAEIQALVAKTAVPVGSQGGGRVRIPVDDTRLAEFCRRNHIRKLSFFGSVLRDDFTPQSDVDVLVEFEEGHTPGLAFFSMQDELSAIIGRKVDLNTMGWLSRHFRDEVAREAEVSYVA